MSHPVYVETSGPEVADICALAGLEPDEVQQQILDLTFAIDGRGKSAAFEVDLIGARQQFKTTALKQMELGWLFVTEERLIVHTAHELDATEEAFTETAELIESTPALARYLKPNRGDRPGITEGNGRWAIQLVSKTGGRGPRLKYKARTKSGGRSLTGNKVVLDEGFALQPSHMGALLPTLTAVPDPQVVTASSAGKLESAVLRDKRNRGRNGKTPRQVYIEYGDPDAWSGCLRVDCTHAKDAEGCALDDEKRWARILPALGTRCTLETIRSMRQSMPPAEFLREFMVWWEDPPEGGDDDDRPIDLGQWGRLVNASAPKPGRVAIFLDVAPDRSSSSIGVAANGSSPGKTLVLVHTRPGTGWVVPKLKKLRAKYDVVDVALHPRSQAAVLVKKLVQEHIEFEAITTTDLGAACAGWISAIEAAELEHVGQAELDAAVDNLRTRFTGEVEIPDRRNQSVDISPAVAAMVAAHRWALINDKMPIPSASYL